MAVVAFQLFPGAGTFTILNATARKGIGIGMKAVFGTLTGDFIYMLAAVLGLAAILSAYPAILDNAQWVGIAYLCWIGVKLLLTSNQDELTEIDLKQNGWSYFRQALVVSLTNPKVMLFFLAFFPIFIGHNSDSVTFIALMIHVTAISLIFQTGLVFIGNAIVQRLSKWKFARLDGARLAGMAFIGFGIKLALSKR